MYFFIIRLVAVMVGVFLWGDWRVMGAGGRNEELVEEMLFSEGLETRQKWKEIEKSYGNIFKRDETEDVLAVTFDGFTFEEMHLLALIAGEKTEKCKTNLEEYCEKLREVDPYLTLVPPLNNICNYIKIDKVCEDLKEKVKSKCNSFDTELLKVMQELSTSTDKICIKYEPLCFFFDQLCSLSKVYCAILRSRCYQMKRDIVAEKVLLMALRGNLTKDNCQKLLPSHCLILSKESNELMQKCFQSDVTCIGLIKNVETGFESLKSEIPKVIDDTNQLRIQCPSLLEKCYLYKKDNEDVKNKCEKLETQCKGINIIYTPPNPSFSPIEWAPELLEMIGLEDLYKKSVRSGVFIGKPKPLDEIDFLALAILQNLDSSKLMKSSEYKKECENKLEDSCKYTPLSDRIKDLCLNKQAREVEKKKCTLLKDVIEGRCGRLKEKLYNKGVSNTSSIWQSTSYGWHQLPTNTLTERDCTELESKCFYFEKHCQTNKLGNACTNLKMACYKRALNDATYGLLEKELRSELNFTDIVDYLTSDNDKLKKFLDHCKKLKKKNIELFILCMRPKVVFEKFRDNIYLKALDLKYILKERRDLPTKKDCVNLLEKCKALLRGVIHLSCLCKILEIQCNFLRSIEELKHYLLEEQKDIFKDYSNCTKILKTKCSHWHRRNRKTFTLPCTLVNNSCMSMTIRVGQHCNAFKENLKKYNQTLIRKNITEKECLLWRPHCRNLTPNCDYAGTVEEIKKVCNSIEVNCESVLEKRRMKDELKHVLKGNLSYGKEDNCNNHFKSLCTQAKDLDGIFFRELCKENEENTRNNANQSLCEQFIKEVQLDCPYLKEKLKKAEKELKVEFDKYKEKREVAEKVIEDENFLLSFKIKKETKGVSLVRRNAQGGLLLKPTVTVEVIPKTRLITVKEALVIEKISEALEFYVELNRTCDKLKSDCDFKEDCYGCNDTCNSILNICGSLDPLKLKEPPVIKEECETKTETEKVLDTSKGKAKDESSSEDEGKVKGESDREGKGKAKGKSDREDREDDKSGREGEEDKSGREGEEDKSDRENEENESDREDKKDESDREDKKDESNREGEGRGDETECTFIRTSNTWVTSMSTHTTTIILTTTKTSTVLLTPTRKCKPTKCTTGKSIPTDDDDDDVVLGEGMRWIPSIGVMIVGLVMAIA